MTNSHGYVLEYPRIRVDHFDQASVALPASLLAHRRSINLVADAARHAERLPFAPGQTHFDKPLLYLLTHIHTDHLKGLERPGITAPIYCSTATKQLLLKYERQKTRIEKDRDGTHAKHIGVVRPYSHLRVTDEHAIARAKLSGFQSTSLDLLQTLPYNVPTKVQYTPTSTVTLTLIESNHMFGATMFLIQGAHGAVLHTGDMRAEPWWCEALTRNPFLSPYLCWSKPGEDPTAVNHSEADKWADHIESFGSNTSSSLQGDQTSSQSQTESSSEVLQRRPTGIVSNDSALVAPPPRAKTKGPRQSQLRLRNIYLDTELLLCNQNVPTKQQACLDMVTLMRMYPPSTVFFLNCWTWGYEDMLIVTAKAFGCKIHVDRFKYIMYKAARTEAPFLADIVTQDGNKTRFHACEKRNVCAAVHGLASRYSATGDPELAREALTAHSQIDSNSEDARQRWGPFRSQPEPLLVYINPGQIAAERWPGMFQDTKRRLQAAQRRETAWPEAMVVPLERHSTLPELQMFVGLFRPMTVSPNTILDLKGGLDYYLLHHLFGHLLAGAADRRKLADEGLLMLGDKTWSFFEAQLSQARQQAQARRGAAADSAEALRSTSASLSANGPAECESLDADQLERLSRLRGISFKGLMMQNMAGNFAAMLEIERWRRAAGIDESPEGLDSIFRDSMGDTQSRTDASVSSEDYDADQSQLAETQAIPSARPLSHIPSHTAQRDEPAPATSAESNEASHARSCASPPLLPATQRAEQSNNAAQTQDSQPSAEEEEPSTELTEDLAIRFLNVLIHHFGVSFDRTTTSYVQMWKSVRQKLPEDAQKVEEHWFRETGVLPPLWSSQREQGERKRQKEAHEQQRGAEGLRATLADPKSSVFGDILESFITMLEPQPMMDEQVELVDTPTVYDRTVALQLILRHFAKLGFHNPVLTESSIDAHREGFSHASCPVDLSAAEWKSLANPLTDLAKQLAAELRSSLTITSKPQQSPSESENAFLSLQLTGILLSYRPFNTVIDRTIVQELLGFVIGIVEAAPNDASTPGTFKRRLVALACAVLRAEELDESLLAPLETRLFALVHDAKGPLRRMESLTETETGSSSRSQSAPEHTPQHGIHFSEGPNSRIGTGDRSYDARKSVDEEASSLQIRPPCVAPPPAPARTTLVQPASPPSHVLLTTTETDSIVASHTAEEGPIESVEALFPQSSQASSSTLEEDSTQSEKSQLGSLPVRAPVEVGGPGRRTVARTNSLPISVRSVGAEFGERERVGEGAKRRLLQVEEGKRSRRGRS